MKIIKNKNSKMLVARETAIFDAIITMMDTPRFADAFFEMERDLMEQHIKNLVGLLCDNFSLLSNSQLKVFERPNWQDHPDAYALCWIIRKAYCRLYDMLSSPDERPILIQHDKNEINSLPWDYVSDNFLEREIVQTAITKSRHLLTVQESNLLHNNKDFCAELMSQYLTFEELEALYECTRGYFSLKGAETGAMLYEPFGYDDSLAVCKVFLVCINKNKLKAGGEGEYLLKALSEIVENHKIIDI